MKKVLFLLLTLSLMTSCAGIKNTINRSTVAEGEPFIKYGVEGFPEGVEVYKGHECMMTPLEIKRNERDMNREKKKSDKALEREQKKFSKNYKG